MAFDYKKEYREFYAPPAKPQITEIPAMNYIAVRGKGDPNEKNGAYKKSIELLYGVAYTIKMSKKGSRQIEGFFDFVVPPLEGFWWQDGTPGIDYAHKENFNWISVIRLPDFVTKADVEWAVREASVKKKADFSAVEFLTCHEGLCVQCMHIGPYDSGLKQSLLCTDIWKIRAMPLIFPKSACITRYTSATHEKRLPKS